MPLSLNAKTRAGYFLVIILMVISNLLVFLTVRKLVVGTGNISKNHLVIDKLVAIRSGVEEAQTRNEDEFANRLRGLVGELREITGISSKIDTLENLIGNFVDAFKSGIVVNESNTDTIFYSRNREQFGKVNIYVDQLLAEEREAVVKNEKALNTDFRSTQIIVITSLVIAIVTIIFSVTTYNRARKDREKADARSDTYRRELESKVRELVLANKKIEDLKELEKFASTGRIARTIAHEVRNPLTNISLATEQLQDASDPDEAAILLDMIRRNSGRINQLVSDLLQSTRFAQLVFSDIKINSLVDETLELARDRIELKKVHVVKEYHEADCKVNVDVEKMKLALLNIMVNGIESMDEEGGVLKLRTFISNENCEIEITDNGTGMDEETQQKIFEPYFTSKNKGNGLGLTNTQNIILNHGGAIKVKTNTGEGTSFFISFRSQGTQDA